MITLLIEKKNSFVGAVKMMHNFVILHKHALIHTYICCSCTCCMCMHTIFLFMLFTHTAVTALPGKKEKIDRSLPIITAKQHEVHLRFISHCKKKTM